jgi:arginyl-tRNA synthetase
MFFSNLLSLPLSKNKSLFTIMNTIENLLIPQIKVAVKSLYSLEIADSLVQIQKTRKEFDGDFTLVVFPLLKTSRKSPEQTGSDIGEYLKKNSDIIIGFNVIKGFLNLVLNNSFWAEILNEALKNKQYGHEPEESTGKSIMVEYSSPNTNKPLHLGHIRNNLLGYSIANLLKASGNKVIKVNLINDRGIHICKSMLALERWGNGITPKKANKKGDHLVGDFYVKFDREYKNQIKKLIAKGQTEEEAVKNAPLILEAQEMLQKWEAHDEHILSVWKLMNKWVYRGFKKTYNKLGVSFDKIYYESKTYLLGKKLVLKGLKKGELYQKDDGSIWADLTSDGLDHKVLLRADGTSVYMTQDLGTAHQRFNSRKFKINQLIYVVGNEQNYHFQALAIVLKKLGFEWANKLKHLSYGMVELPEGKMKSREGTVVDADDLLDEMFRTARQMAQELGKLDGMDEAEKNEIIRIIGLGALKYFILKVDPKKNMVFDPKESIDFNGNTGPFIQYTYARIRSVLRKADEMGIEFEKLGIALESIGAKEKGLLKYIFEFPELVKEAAESLSPAIIANYLYELAKEFNQFYHDFSILKEANIETRDLRILLSSKISDVLKSGMGLMGIEVPERM